MKELIVVGIDPGAIHTGVAAVKFESGKPSIHNVLTISEAETVEMARQLSRFLKSAIDESDAGEIDVALLTFEVSPRRGPDGRQVFYKSSGMTQRTIGGIDVLVAMGGISMFYYDEEEMRQFCTGKRNAAKKQIREYVKRQIGDISIKMDAHIYDACAATLTHVGSPRLQRLFVQNS